MKHYRIRKLSFMWWFTRVGGTIVALFGCYCWIMLAFMLSYK